MILPFSKWLRVPIIVLVGLELDSEFHRSQLRPSAFPTCFVGHSKPRRVCARRREPAHHKAGAGVDGSARRQWVIVAPSRSGSSCRARFSRSDSSPPPCGAARVISRPTRDRPRGDSARARRSSEAHGFNHLIVLDASAAYKASGAPSTLPGGLPPPTAASSQRRRGQAHAEAPLPRVRVVRSRHWPAGCSSCVRRSRASHACDLGA